MIKIIYNKNIKEMVFVNQRNNTHLKADFSLNETREEDEFAIFIRQKLTKSNTHKNFITRQELSSRMGVEWDTLKKVINKNRETASRDYIIAICSQIGMNSEETNMALYLYNMPPLCCGSADDTPSEYFKRDDLLITILENASVNYMSLDDIDNELFSHKLRPLNLPYRKSKFKKLSNYKVIDEAKRIDIEDSFFKEYNSLEDQFKIKNYSCVNSMLIELDETKEKLVLKYRSNGECSVHEFDRITNPIPKISYKTIDDVDEYPYCFARLRIKNKSEIKKLSLQLDDTKNYKERISAKYRDGKIVIFIERFNYYVPELNEYYFVEYSNGEWNYSISKKSQFMFNKMNEDEYLNIYNEYDAMKIASGHSIDELIESYNNYLSGMIINDYIKKRIRKEMPNLEEKIVLLINKLKNREIFIRNPEIVKDEINPEYSLCRYFKVVDKFKFRKEKDDYEEYYSLVKSEILYKGIIISISDLYSAFELGLKTIDDICNVKNIYGSIEALRENL